MDAVRPQPVRHLVGPRIEFRVGYGFAIAFHRGMVRSALRLLLEIVMQQPGDGLSAVESYSVGYLIHALFSHLF